MNIIIAVLNFLFAGIVLMTMICYKPWNKSISEMMTYGFTLVLPIISGIALLI